MVFNCELLAVNLHVNKKLATKTSQEGPRLKNSQQGAMQREKGKSL